MSNQNTQQYVTFVRRLYDEVYSKGNLQVLDEIMSENVKLHDPAAPQHKDGLRSIKELENSYKKAFPNKKVKLDDIFGLEDKVVVRWTCHGTQKGDLQGIAATNKDFTISGISIYKFSNGKIAEMWQFWDRLGLLEQIGEVERSACLHY